MKKKILLSFLLLVYSSIYSQNKRESYDCVNAYLEIKGVNKKENHVLIKEKLNNKSVLRIFFGGDSINYHHNYRSPLFNNDAWKELYKNYSADTITRYWCKNDFPNFNFIYEHRKGLWNWSFLDKYENNSMKVYFISEPLYYDNRKYILFEVIEAITDVSSIQRNQVIVMRKKENKWEIVETIYDYVLH